MKTEFKIQWWNKGRPFTAWTKDPAKAIEFLKAYGIKAYCLKLGLN